MAEVVLSHHVQGLTEGVRAFAGERRASGHTVHDGIPVQIHGMDKDPFFALEGAIDAARELVETVGAELAEVFVYPGNQDLFADNNAGLVHLKGEPGGRHGAFTDLTFAVTNDMS